MALHMQRLRDGKAKIPEFRGKRTNAHAPEFKGWKDRVEQALGALFSKDHDYTKRFGALTFWRRRIVVGGARSGWSGDDQARLERDLELAEQILVDALEELDVAPETAPTLAPPHRARPGSAGQLPIVVNVTNILSQATAVHVSQLLASLQDIDLTPGQRAAVEEHARSLETEARGQQRWPIMAKSLEALKTLGRPVYERVALPLLLDILKKQAGM